MSNRAVHCSGRVGEGVRLQHGAFEWSKTQGGYMQWQNGKLICIHKAAGAPSFLKQLFKNQYTGK
jgi:hypothetical protein